MAELKYAHCFITADKPDMKLPSYRVPVDPKFVKRITVTDKDTPPGGKFYSETMWILPGFEYHLTREVLALALTKLSVAMLTYPLAAGRSHPAL